jgi:hypothetical protein
MAPAHAMLSPAASDPGIVELSEHVDPYAARREYVENGQGGLDDLLAALDGGFEVRLGQVVYGIMVVQPYARGASVLGCITQSFLLFLHAAL